MNKTRFTPENITELKDNEIFVFGSNMQGRHFGGAALIAWKKFGAEFGNPIGIQGQTYAIPTMFETADEIKPYVDEFKNYAKVHNDKVFLVTKIGMGIAGFALEEIAPLFKECSELDNVVLPKEFYEYYLR